MQAAMKQRQIEIKDKEIGHYTNSFNMIATQAALLAGFSFSALTMGHDLMVMPPLHRWIFVNACTACTTLNLASVVISTFCSEWHY